MKLGIDPATTRCQSGTCLSPACAVLVFVWQKQALYEELKNIKYICFHLVFL